MAENRRGLGRGLSALLGEEDVRPAGAAPGSTAPGVSVREIPIEFLQRNPDQPRWVFPETQLAELAASIRDKGILQPILVRPKGEGRYEIVAGERRWRAAQQAGLAAVPVLVRELTDMQVLEIGVIENVQRADLSPIEEATAYRQLMDRFGRTQDSVAEAVGKSRSHVANTLRLLQLPEEVLWYVRHGQLSAGHARALVNVPGAAELAKQIVDEGLNVRQAEALARRAAEGPKPARRKAAADAGAEGSADVAALEQDLADALGLKVQLADRGGKGELTIRYGTLEQLDDLCRRLMRG